MQKGLWFQLDECSVAGQPTPDPHLIRAVAQGHHWFTQLLDGEAPSVRDITKNSGVHHGDISGILPLGLLAPDIVEAILTGHQPVELPTRRLKRLTDLPVAWAEQRRVLGFARSDHSLTRHHQSYGPSKPPTETCAPNGPHIPV